MRTHEMALNKTKTKASFAKEMHIFGLFGVCVCEYNTISNFGLNQIKNEVKVDLQFRISQCQFWLNVLISDKRGDIFEILLKWKSSTNSREISEVGGAATPVSKGHRRTPQQILFAPSFTYFSQIWKSKFFWLWGREVNRYLYPLLYVTW